MGQNLKVMMCSYIGAAFGLFSKWYSCAGSSPHVEDAETFNCLVSGFTYSVIGLGIGATLAMIHNILEIMDEVELHEMRFPENHGT